MKRYKAAWRYYFFLILFTAVSLLGIWVFYMLFAGQVSFGDDLTSAENKFLSVFTIVALSLPLSTYALSAFRLWCQLIKYKGAVLTITEKGVENTLVFTWLLAFVFIKPVKLIPWESVTYYDNVDGAPYIRMKVKEVNAGWLARMILRLFGFMFHVTFIKPKVSEDDILPYRHRFQIKP